MDHQARLRAVAATRPLHDQLADRSTVFESGSSPGCDVPGRHAARIHRESAIASATTGPTRSRTHSRHRRHRQAGGVPSFLLMASGSVSGRTSNSKRSRSPAVRRSCCVRRRTRGARVGRPRTGFSMARAPRGSGASQRRRKARERREGRRDQIASGPNCYPVGARSCSRSPAPTTWDTHQIVVQSLDSGTRHVVWRRARTHDTCRQAISSTRCGTRCWRCLLT